MAAHDSTHSVPSDGPAAVAPRAPVVTNSVAETGASDGGNTPTPVAGSGRYLFGAEIARGGMGVVYRATDTAFDREVAVKVLRDKFDPASDMARRFHDEARITGQLQHPAIPPVFDLGTLPDGRPFLAMKLIEGDTLADLLNARPNPSADRGRFVAVFEQVCQAVACAHAHNVIHRDLKPANAMVGTFGEVQVMDWGLAKVLESRARPRPESDDPTDPDETVGEKALRSVRASDGAFTQAGTVLGTLAYMPPEQARGAVHAIDARSDVFGLGAILAVILTGEPPFVASSAEATRLMAAQGNVAECFARLDASGAEPELVALCKRCLSKKARDRPSDGGAVARAVAKLRAGADERARRAELERVTAEGDRIAAELRAEGERQKVEEQRKRRRVQLALAGFAVLVAIGGGAVANMVQQERAAKKGADEKLIAETNRQADLQQARADALVDALTTAETVAVPRVVADLKEFRDRIVPKLGKLAEQPIGTKPGLHARCALLAGDLPTGRPNGRAAELAAYLPVCKPEELLTIRAFLEPYAGEVAPALWTVLTDAKAGAGQRVRAACALAGLVPADERWTSVASTVSDLVVLENPLEAAVWFRALEPVRGALVPALVARYPEARARIRGGKLDEVQLAAEVIGYDLTATALARYTAQRPAEAAELMLLVDPRHAAQFVPALTGNPTTVVPMLKAELAKKPSADWTDEEHETLGRRRGQAAAALLALGEAEPVWPMFGFPPDGDPTARSYLLARLVDVGADPSALIRRFEVEPDVTAKQALLVALGGFPPDVVPAAERRALSGRLLTLYREHPDPGFHGAIDWVLRQKWGHGKELAAIDEELAAVARGRVTARALAGAGQPLGDAIGPRLPCPRAAAGKDWFVNGAGQTYAVVRGPVEFALGSPKTEPGRNEVNEPPHRKQIPRTFAIGTKEVTVEQFLRFRSDHHWNKRYSPGPDTPAVAVTWYDAAEYCNWLSAREGIPREQWCYEPAEGGIFGNGMRIKSGHLKLTGYRLPTEAEWEYACRSGAATAHYHGRGEDLLPRYGWHAKNSDDRARPVGQLRPNDLGLFDMLGNAIEWVEDPGLSYVTSLTEDTENSKTNLIDERMSRIVRGGAFNAMPQWLRSSDRNAFQPGIAFINVGFRPVRTLPE